MVLVLKILKTWQIGRILLPLCDLPDFPYLVCGSWNPECSQQVPVHKYQYILQFCYINAKSGIKPAH
jgi:hypothetical protein